MSISREEFNVLDRITELRESRGWSLNQLSAKAGLPEATLRLDFKRGTEPTMPTICAVCEGLNISLAEFFTTGEIPKILTQREMTLLHLWEKQPEHKQDAVLVLLQE